MEDTEDDDISEDEDPLMLQRDAKDWKNQDHYAVLGLSKHRYRASEEQIKRASRKKTLRHHPDKRAAAGGTEDDSFFKCIQKATDTLLDPVRRRQFDSVDENANVAPPSKKQSTKGDFYAMWGPVFESEARFSRDPDVPMLGDMSSSKEHVMGFYDFWLRDFDSWRSFEYLDEDVPDDNESRDQKRMQIRKNNNARQKRKKEDTVRLRALVEECMALDTRIKQFQTADRANKNKKRIEREAAERKAKEDAIKALEEEKRQLEAAAEAAKAAKADQKKAKEAAKTAVKKNKRVLRGSIKDANYFAQGSASAAQIDGTLNEVDALIAKLEPEEVAALADSLSASKDPAAIKQIWTAEVVRLQTDGRVKEGEAKYLV